MIDGRFPHIMNGLNSSSAPKYTFLVFFASVVDGEMWCPVSNPLQVLRLQIEADNIQDCRRVESTVNEAFDGPDKPSEGILICLLLPVLTLQKPSFCGSGTRQRELLHKANGTMLIS